MKVSELKQKFGAFQVYWLLVIVMGLCLYAGFHTGNMYYLAQEDSIAVHQQSVANLKMENNRLIKNLNILGVELEVAKLAQQKAFSELEQGIEREKALKTQIAFYQQVMSPESAPEGLQVDGFYVQPTLSLDTYRFELVLIQQNKMKNMLRGNLSIELRGSEKGQAKKYSLDALLVNPGKDKFKFGFKYFQVIDGELLLPEGFEPEQVSISADIYVNKRKKAELASTFDWLVSDS
ncbi:DUF6776 family protein [Paraglaciecola aquimarina]|uniref:DUF6776 family protein n=1 Tax=Paraglaciecola aquimarina TaxID=1235557 RepID=A0ABU3SS04_9ALTE|nr:DUF6776 family protein [Paraglaciecola aquimarina]MDU0352804.1 DUF6776 family protein [Paraglaciecola aquimarina]